MSGGCRRFTDARRLPMVAYLWVVVPWVVRGRRVALVSAAGFGSCTDISRFLCVGVAGVLWLWGYLGVVVPFVSRGWRVSSWGRLSHWYFAVPVVGNGDACSGSCVGCCPGKSRMAVHLWIAVWRVPRVCQVVLISLTAGGGYAGIFRLLCIGVAGVRRLRGYLGVAVCRGCGNSGLSVHLRGIFVVTLVSRVSCVGRCPGSCG